MEELKQTTEKYDPDYVSEGLASLDSLKRSSLIFFNDVAEIYDCLTRLKNIERNPGGFSLEDAPILGLLVRIARKDAFDKSMYTGQLPQRRRMVPSGKIHLASYSSMNEPASGRNGYRSGANVYKFASPNCEADEQVSSQRAETMNVYKASIDSDELKKLSVLQPWGTMAALALDWAAIAAAIALSSHFGGVWLYLLAVAVIAGRMHGLGVLMHEAAHFRFLKNRKMADVVADLFIAWPVMATVDGYRQNHLAHHQHANTDKDPDWVVKLGKAAYTFPQEVWVMILNLLGYLVVVNSLRDLAHILPRVTRSKQTGRYRLARFGYYLGAATLITLLGIWKGFLLYWIVPYMTLFFLFVHVRGVAEHFGSMDYDEELGSTRTVIPYFWERCFFAPHNINYHLEHHLFPGVPFYNLPKLSAALMRDETYRAKAHITRGYSTGVLRECLAAAKRDKPGQLVQT